MMKRQYSILILYFLCFAIGNATSNSYLDSLLKELDLAISKDGQYREQKENYLFQLRARLTILNLTIEDQYDIYSRLTDEFEYYRCDSANYYGSKKLALAVASDKLSWIIESKIKLATILSHTALFREGIELLDSISPDDLSSAQESEYYKAYYEVYVAWSDFLYNEFQEYQTDLKRDTYHELFISSLSRNRYEYAAYYGIKYVNNNEPEKAEELLLNSLPQYSLGTRPYSILASVVSSLYLSKGDLVKTKEYLALSAISDIRGNIMENTSLRELANYLFEENKIEQANRYIKKSMEDANFYNSRIRNFQTSRVLPIIDRAYQEDRARQEKKMQVFLLIISILSLVLLSGLFVLFRQIRKVSATRKKISDMNEQLQINNQILADTNKALTDTSQIKEEYIGRFLGLCPVYIEKMEKYRKRLLNQAKSGKAEDLYKMIRSTQFIEDERTEFYNGIVCFNLVCTVKTIFV